VRAVLAYLQDERLSNPEGGSAVENEYDGPSVRLLFEAAEVVHESVRGSLCCVADGPPGG
jgi:hypothetical protein